MVPQTREVVLEGGAYILRENEGEARPFDGSAAEALLQVLRDERVDAWDGFSGSDPRVLDGEMFSLELEYADGTTVSAYGSNAFPGNYHAVTDRIESIFRAEKAAFLSGTYRYEGEGFGGDFTVTLNADGTYAFYEGPLSSYLGMGTWDVYDDTVYLTEDEETGFALRFVFRFVPEADALVYLAGGSDTFPCVNVPDGGRFVRPEASEGNMTLYIGETRVPVTWERNESVEALRALLPLRIRMSMYGGFEQVGPIGQSIVRSDSRTETEAGDIVLYSGDQIVVFYGSNSWSYTRLGHAELSRQEMEDLLAHGDVILTITEE